MSIISRIRGCCCPARKVETIPSMGGFELFRRVDVTEREEIEGVVKALPKAPSGALVAFEQGDYDHSIFQNGDWPYYAIRFVLQGKLSTNDFAKLMLYRECKPLEATVLNDGDEIRREVRRSFIDTFRGRFKTDDIRTFFDSLDETDQIFAVPRRNARTGGINTITSSFDGFRKTLYVLPPATLQKFYNAISGIYHERIFHPHTIIEVHPVVGFSSPEDFEYEDRRDVWIPCPGVSTPKHLHEVKNPSGLGIYIHDAYFHCLLEQVNPHRKVWIAIAKHLQPKYPQFYEALLDRDFEIHYQQGTDFSEIFNSQVRDIIAYFDDRDDPTIFEEDKVRVFYKIYDFLFKNPELLSEAGIELELDDTDSSDSSSWTSTEETG
ncbi:MAG: hypothetical protein P0S96_04580 [Simkaniaceae bacterium]|nr:hypothetical protein [Candidatus Sacchlamyda saccharinae]